MDYQKLLQIHKKRLQILEEKRAVLGISTPPGVLIEIENIKEEIASISDKLKEIEATKQATKDKDKSMDVTPFVPIIVEATKFFFEQVNSWITDVHKKAELPQSNAETSGLPVTEEQIITAQAKSTHAVLKLISQSTSEIQVKQVQNLKEQIEIAYDVLAELEKQELTSTGQELAKIRVNIKTQAKLIAEKVDYLQSLLLKIYR